MRDKKVFVLGAGFSAAGGIPVLNNFFSEVEKRKSEVNSYLELKRFEYVLKFRDFLIREGIDTNMESAFVYIDDRYKANKNGELQLNGFNITNQELRRHFLYVICRTFHLCWTNNGRSNEYKGFKIKNLYKNFIFKIMEHKPTIITFNYDLIIDNLLMINGLIPNYGFDVEKCEDIDYIGEENLKSKKNPNGILQKCENFTLLKLHGSLNWFQCRECEKYYLKLDVNDNWSTKGDALYAFSGEECKYRASKHNIQSSIKKQRVMNIINKGDVEKLLTKGFFKQGKNSTELLEYGNKKEWNRLHKLAQDNNKKSEFEEKLHSLSISNTDDFRNLLSESFRDYIDFVMIPPIQYKTTPEKLLLKQVWNTAKEKIRDASEIVFVGYSFPSTDKNIINFFRELLMQNCLLERVVVINKKVDRELELKYEYVVGEKYKKRIEYYPSLFQDVMLHCLDSIL